MTTWNMGKTPKRRAQAACRTAACLLAVQCFLVLQDENLTTTTLGENPPRKTIAMPTRVTQIHGTESESSTT